MSTTTTVASATKTNAVGLYKVDLVAGNEGLPGAPILRLSLLVNAASGKVVGQGTVSQAIEGGEVPIHKITGQVRSTGFGEYTKIVALEGEAFVSFPPPAIGSYLAPFTSHFAIDDAWNGQGGWQVEGSNPVEGVPFKSVDHG